jgi:AraC-like DNA-binding protein
MPTTHVQSKIFQGAHFTLHYRRAARLNLTFNAQPALTLLCLLDGALACQFNDEASRESAQAKSINDQRETANIELARCGALFINSDESLTARGKACEILQVSLEAAFALECAVRAGFVRDDALLRFRHRFARSDEKLFRLARSLTDELNAAQKGRELMLASLVEQLTIHILRQHAHFRRDASFELSRVGLVDRRIRRAVELMHNALERDLSLEEIAAAAYLSPFHFARLFKKATGATPHAYLAALRLARAQRLLAETDLSITEISGRVGYQSASHFAKSFHQATGLTPREFRRSLIKDQSTSLKSASER